MPSSACDWSSDVCSSDRSEEHTSELQSRSDLVCRILRSEEHTSELQSRSDLGCRLLLVKKNAYAGLGSARRVRRIMYLFRMIPTSAVLLGSFSILRFRS